MRHALALAVLATLHLPVKPTKHFNGQQPNRGFERRLVTQRAATKAVATAAPVQTVVFLFLPTAPSLSAQCTGAALTGTKGEAITFTRSGAQTCSKSDGTVVSLASNQPALEAAGLHVEQGTTNNILQSRDLSSAVWTKSSATCTKTATGTDAASNSASTCTASGANATVLQSITFAAATRSSSFYLRRNTGTGNVQVTRNGGTTWTTVTLTGSWVRFGPSALSGSISALSSGIANPTVGINIVTSGDAVDVDRVQDEALPFESSAIDTTTTATTRNSTSTDLPNFTLSGTPSQAMTWMSAGSQALAILSHTGTGANERLEMYNASTAGAIGCAQISASNVATLKQHSTVVVATTPTRLGCYYDGAAVGVCVGGVCQTTTAAGLTLTAATTVNAIGYLRNTGSSNAMGWISSVCIDSTSGGCR